jgi:deoxyribodipyrimidine photo-lyase
MTDYRLALHIFRRDLRVQDNTALINSLRLSGSVIPSFILDKRQLGDHPYRSEKALQFMTGCLKDLGRQLGNSGGRLFLFSGIAEDIVEKLIKELGIDAVFVNRDYTPFSRDRDGKIEKICHDNRIAFRAFPDALLNEPEDILKENGRPYTIFTPYFRKSVCLPVQIPRHNSYANFYTGRITYEEPSQILDKLISASDKRILLAGGRQEAITLLDKIPELADYETIRNIPSEAGTSFLSAHIKFGTVSVREIYKRISDSLGVNHSLIRALYWRDFFTQIAWHFPSVFGHSFHDKFDKIEWENDPEKFQAWCEGNTGFPIVDAGMRQLNATGWMHNRVRMIVAGFLVKDLHSDWRQGEKYFARKLIDYDPAVNNGNWQWAASTGCDAQPYFRIFNPWLQQKKFDSEGAYIRQWIPELRDLSPKQLQNLYRLHPPGLQYPEPVVDHKLAASAIRDLYAALYV